MAAESLIDKAKRMPVKIDSESYSVLKRLAKTSGKTISRLLSEAVSLLERQGNDCPMPEGQGNTLQIPPKIAGRRHIPWREVALGGLDDWTGSCGKWMLESDEDEPEFPSEIARLVGGPGHC